MKKAIYTLLLSLLAGVLFPLHAQENSQSVRRTVRKSSDNQKVDDAIVYRDFRFAVGGGYAHRLGKTLRTGDAAVDKITDELKNGFNIDMEGQYFFKEHFGLGLNIYYNRQTASGSGILTSGDILINNAKEHTTFIYVGPTANLRYNLGETFTLYMSMGIGPVFFKDEANMDGGIYTMNKTAFGSYASISGDYNINHYIGLGLKLSAGGGTVSGKDFGQKDRLSLSNFMVTAYVSFRASK
ncbi:outer membrane beta-barrel protein [Prevotella sp. 10(H)]|uniref:outer membrane beta-barrel protein n=1 Tax=Prevotella sp. 10(H) TaxID=1158294 RepID=UPI0004A71CFA|nr:outer membrane beta-barrel protein [Prevotella sp. 10(H)]